jgi:hypothetical protein
MNVTIDKLHQQYRTLQSGLASGWNTFNPTSVLSHVLLPHGFNMQICIKNTFICGNQYLKESYISSKDARPEKITPGYHAYDGSYTELLVEFEGSKFKVESATENEEIYILLNPIKLPWKNPHVVLETGMLWNRKGEISLTKNQVTAGFGDKVITVSSTAPVLDDYLPVNNPYLSVEFNGTIGFYTGKKRSLIQIMELIEKKRIKHEESLKKYQSLTDTYNALQSVIAWNIIYDPFGDRVIFPVSRVWNSFFGGPYVLFDWDTYFGAYMASLGSKELAYANAVEITKHITKDGFIPNYIGGYDLGSHDRSQPPVGSRIFRELYKKFQEKWILEYVFDDLLTWNRWWNVKRVTKGLLCWGSDPLPEPNNGDCNNWQAAAYETGLDNSPMYDSVPFNTKTHKMELADVGLMGMYVMDCDSLAEIAGIIGRKTEANELKERADKFRSNLKELWSEEKGIFLNKRTDTGQFSTRLCPTLFYAMLAKAPTQAQAERMIKEHFMNPEEFAGEWILPSISRNDPAFNDQDYWRGRIWGPMNFLVYLGMKNYDLTDAVAVMVEKSHALLMNTWNKNRMVHENYNAITGNGRNEEERINLSDSYYHWGALLGFMAILEGEGN